MNERPFIGVCGDVHGHLQLALCAWALEQQSTGRCLDAILLCGDVGTFTSDCTLDKATTRHAAHNPCELEFRQWSRDPWAPWLDGIFASVAAGGLGLDAPVIMCHGNHEGWDHLELLTVDLGAIPDQPVRPSDLPAVDLHGRIRLLPSGWRVLTAAGTVVGGVGGIEPGQRLGANYPPMAYIDPDAVARLAATDRLDVIITHQGPAKVQGASSGAESLDALLQRQASLLWFHGHSRQQKTPITVGQTQVVPLGDAAFDRSAGWRVANDAWHSVERVAGTLAAVPRRPSRLPELARRKWIPTPDGQLVAPHLAAWMPG